MQIVRHAGTEEFLRQADEWCRQRISRFDGRARSMFLPAGNTPVPLYRHWEATRPDFLADLELRQIDECLGVAESQTFRAFFRSELPSYLPQLRLLREHDVDFAERADFCVLGLGTNGHVAFHEPGLHPSFSVGCVRLSEETRRNLKLPADCWGLSYGAATFLRSRSILMIVRGAGKRAALAKMINGDRAVTAALLTDHADLTVLADTEALGPA